MTNHFIISKSLDGSEPSSLLVQLGLFSAHAILGISAVVATIGLSSFHPLTFVLIRGVCASTILLIVSHFYSISMGRERGILSGSRKDWSKFALSGFGIFSAQVCCITGIKLTSAVTATVWQPSAPIITAAVCMILGWEPFSFLRCVGILVAFLGCTVMVLGGEVERGIRSSSGDSSAFPHLLGQLFFLISCFGVSLYVLASKRIIGTTQGRYESVTITAWSYTFSAVYMLIFSILMSLNDSVISLLCPDCGSNIWHVPRHALPALIHFILFTSCVVYGLITWASRYATGTLVIGYTVVQPVASAILIQVLITAGLFKGCAFTDESDDNLDDVNMDDWNFDDAVVESYDICLEQPDIFTAIGAVGVFIGLMVVIYTEPKSCEDEDTVTSDMDYTDFDVGSTISEIQLRKSASDSSSNSDNNRCLV